MRRHLVIGTVIFGSLALILGVWSTAASIRPCRRHWKLKIVHRTLRWTNSPTRDLLEEAVVPLVLLRFRSEVPHSRLTTWHKAETYATTTCSNWRIPNQER